MPACHELQCRSTVVVMVVPMPGKLPSCRRPTAQAPLPAEADGDVVLGPPLADKFWSVGDGRNPVFTFGNIDGADDATKVRLAGQTANTIEKMARVLFEASVLFFADNMD